MQGSWLGLRASFLLDGNEVTFLKISLIVRAAEYPAVKSSMVRLSLSDPQSPQFSFLVSATVSYQTLGGFKQHAFIVLVLEVRSPNFRRGQSPAPSGGSRGGKSFLPLPASGGSSLSWLMATSRQPLPLSSSGLLPLCLHVCIIRTIVTELSRILNAMAPKTLFPSKVTLTVSRVGTKTCLSKGHYSTLYTHP